ALARAFEASTSRSRGGAVVTRESRSSCAAWATRSRARAKASSFALEGLVKPLNFRTNWREDARISSSVAGGLKLCRVLMFRHIGTPRRHLTDRALTCAPPAARVPRWHARRAAGAPATPPAARRLRALAGPGRRRVSCSALGSGRSQGSGNISRAAEISFAHGLLLQAWVNSSHSVNVPSPGERWR